jgi:hypothetical protein
MGKKDSSFDIVSQVDIQEVDNAVNHATREAATRYDLKKAKSKISYDKHNLQINLEAENDYVLRSLSEVLKSKLVKRKVPLKSLVFQKVQVSHSGRASQEVKIIQGISKDKAREITKKLKRSFPRIKVNVEDDKVRVASKSKDELQLVIKFLRNENLSFPIQFTNFR